MVLLNDEDEDGFEVLCVQLIHRLTQTRVHGQYLTHTVIYAFPFLRRLSWLLICGHAVSKTSVRYFFNKLVELSLLIVLKFASTVLVVGSVLVLLHICKSTWWFHFK